MVVLVAAATVDNERQNQPSLPRLEMDTLSVPALKSRAKLTRSLPRPGKDGCVIFSNAINPRLNSNAATAAGRPEQLRFFSQNTKPEQSAASRHKSSYCDDTDEESFKLSRTFSR